MWALLLVRVAALMTAATAAWFAYGSCKTIQEAERTKQLMALLSSLVAIRSTREAIALRKAILRGDVVDDQLFLSLRGYLGSVNTFAWAFLEMTKGLDDEAFKRATSPFAANLRAEWRALEVWVGQERAELAHFKPFSQPSTTGTFVNGDWLTHFEQLATKIEEAWALPKATGGPGA